MSDAQLTATRRAFLEASMHGVAGALIVSACGREAFAAHGGAPPEQLQPGPLVCVHRDGGVVIYCHRTEMGQGVRSSLPVLIADELGADLSRVRVLQADGDAKYGDQNTDGSSSVRGHFDELRTAGAAARMMLTQVAATRLGVPASECTARDHAVWHKQTSLPFAELVAAAAALPVPKAPTLRPRAELRHLGKATPLLDGKDIATGRALYAADLRLPGMLTAVLLRPPTVWGRVQHFNADAALRVPGVKRVIELPPLAGFAARFQPLGGLAVVAEHTWSALCGRDALDVSWDLGPNADYQSTTYRDALLESVRTPGHVVRNIGDVEAALKQAARVVSAEYYLPHLTHAPMEPPAALANVVGDRCEVWACTQDPQGAVSALAEALGIPKEKVTVHVTLVGGGFGRKSMPDFILEAALLSRTLYAPVRVQWTRTDDIQHGYYHSVSAQRLDAAIDATGAVTAWRQRTSFPTIGSTFMQALSQPQAGELGLGLTDLPLAVPNVRMESGEAKAKVRIGWLRSVCNVFHAFAAGCFIDELAHARGRDPRDTWLELAGPARHVSAKDAGVDAFENYGATLADHPIDVGRYRHVIERVTAACNWQERKRPGRALGLAAHRSFLSAVAVVVALEERDGRIVVDEAWTVIDAGTILNRDRVVAQMEGGVIFGMSLALYGALTVKNGAVEQSNFHDYRQVRSTEAPRRIHVDIVESTAPPGGVGEAGVPPVAPAIANALFALTGRRVRELPLRAFFTKGGAKSAPQPRTKA